METEDTQSSLKADAAAVKRKRRSSILKNQRPPRTPFSEVEFNVATPPDTTKSRRVSFSRRTGVAEFVTNEATTTWRNFYEEHNKSLESSGNENNLATNAPRQTIEHIGKRIFDQQFEEVEAVDLGGTIYTNPLQQFQASFNKINLTQELASLECMTDDLKFVPSQSKFEQSALTELSKPFGNDIQCPVMEDMTNPISMNFSRMQPLSSSKCDDLDEIQNHLEKSKPSTMCPGPMNPGKDFSGYIEVADLDVTQGVIHNDCSEMSITDTIESPKVVQQSKQNVEDDWTNDKENMIFNPYVAPKESLTFAVSKVSDEVLVFDGKRLTTQPVTSNITEDKEDFRQTLIPNAPTNAPQRKTIILDVNDDLPNFIDNNSSKSNFNLQDNMGFVSNNANTATINKNTTNNTIGMCNNSKILSFTQAISSNDAKRETMIQDISMTQTVPNNIVQINEENKLQTDNGDKHRTMIFADESCDISMTQALQSNINFNSEQISAKNGNTIIFDNDARDISMTQALPTNIDVNIVDNHQDDLDNKNKKDAATQKRKTIVFDEDSCNLSITQAVPVSIIGSKYDNGLMSKNSNSEKRKTIIFDNESCDISMTQALPTNININKEIKEINCNILDEQVKGNKNFGKHRTIIFDNDSCDISVTQALNINIVENKNRNNEIDENITNYKSSEKRRTIIFDKDSCDISVTQAVPTSIDFIENLASTNEVNNGALNENSVKCRTIIFNKESCDISMTQAVSTNIDLIEHKNCDENYEIRRSTKFDKTSCNTSVSQYLPVNIIENLVTCKEISEKEKNKENSEKRTTIFFDNDSCDVSVTQVIPSNIDIKGNVENNCKGLNEDPQKRKTIIFDENSCDVSMTQVLPTNISFNPQNIKQQLSTEVNETSIKGKTNIFDQKLCEISITKASPTNFNIFNDNIDKDDKIDIKLESENHDNSKSNLMEENKINNVLDNICKSSDNEQPNVEIQSDDMEVTDLCKSTQLNALLDEEKKNDKANSSSNKYLGLMETSYINVSKSKIDVEDGNVKLNTDDKIHLLGNETTDNINIESGVLSHLDKENKIFLNPNESKFKTNILYQVDKNNQNNKTNTNTSCYDELVAEMNIDKPLNQFIDRSIKDHVQENESNSNSRKPRPKKSILDELLSMSSDSVKHNLSECYEKNGIVVTDNSVFMSTSKQIESSLVGSKPTQNNEIQPSLETINNDSVVLTENLADKCHYKELKNDIGEVSDNKQYQEDGIQLNTELEESVQFIAGLNSPKTIKSVEEADNTKDLLKMLSDITDEDGEKTISKQENFDVKIEYSEKSAKAEKNSNASKGTLQEPKRLSLAPRRQSIAISREDLLNNISMAKAALQQSRFEVDETDIMDDTSELMETHEINDSHKSNRLSKEVVKTLQFEDESASDTSFKSEIKMTPLRKLTIDEITVINEDKAKVIPTFLTDASVSLKELMNDLVKPNSDAPFKNNFSKLNTSTCNAEVETNVITPSQEESLCLLKNSDDFILRGENKNVGVEVGSASILNDIKSSIADSEAINVVQNCTDVKTNNLTLDNNIKCDIHSINVTSPQKSKNESIFFNSDDPLKNVLLPPIDYADAHRYNKSHEAVGDKNLTNKSRQLACETMELDYTSLDNHSIMHDVINENKIAEQMNIVCGKTDSERSGASSINLNISKPTYADESVESVVPCVKDIEVNTMIAMKDSKELSQSSSLTLINERVMDTELKINIEPSLQFSNEEVPSSKISQVKILFKNENDAELTEKDATSSEDISNIDLDAKTRKRSYSPTSTNSYVLPNVELTPKPISKMQKMSHSPLTKCINNKIHIMQVDLDKDRIKDTKSDELQFKYAQTEIIQKVEIQYNNDIKSKSNTTKTSQGTKLDGENASEHEASLNKCSNITESDIQDPSVIISQVVSSVTSRISPLVGVGVNKMKINDGPDVVEDIKLLSFMGTSECEWEQCERAGVWAFRLLCGRVRLCVQLDSTVVRVDTPVTAIDFEIAKADEKDAIAGMCVNLAIEAMRYEAAEVPRADAVGALLRRCVRVTRLARRWARAMRDAHARLAYHVLPDGHISLKVANLPMRRVVEARLHVSLAVRCERGAAYPCADHLALMAGAGPPQGAGVAADLARLADQPPDWGHVPRTIWKVFKYLKNRTRTEELLGN